jgi:hypothetical protein
LLSTGTTMDRQIDLAWAQAASSGTKGGEIPSSALDPESHPIHFGYAQGTGVTFTPRPKHSAAVLKVHIDEPTRGTVNKHGRGHMLTDQLLERRFAAAERKPQRAAEISITWHRIRSLRVDGVDAQTVEWLLQPRCSADRNAQMPAARATVTTPGRTSCGCWRTPPLPWLASTFGRSCNDESG